MENGLDINAANSIANTADMHTDTLDINNVTYVGSEAAARTMERTLSQSTSAGQEARDNAQAIVGTARDIAESARMVNGSNRGA
jgi:hypothetical protein